MACPAKRSQKPLRQKLVPIPLIVLEWRFSVLSRGSMCIRSIKHSDYSFEEQPFAKTHVSKPLLIPNILPFYRPSLMKSNRC